MKTINIKVSDEMHMKLKALAKAYGQSLSDCCWFALDGTICNREDSSADMEIYEKELKRLKAKS